MGEFVITCCSTADMDRNFFEEREIPFACFHCMMDGKEYQDDLGKSMAPEEFYRRIAAGAQPTTAQVNVKEYEDLFRPALEQGKDVLHIALSGGISGAVNSARLAKEQLEEEFPERRILVVDSLGASSGYGLLVMLADDMRKKGAGLEETAAWTEEHRLNIHHWFFSSDLTSFIRGGRISKTAGFFGTALGICPLMNVDASGKLVPREKYRGKKKVIRAMVEKMKEHARDGENYSGRCLISQSACYEDARAVADLVEQEFPRLSGPVEIHSIGMVIGSHTGPGTVALFFEGDQRQ